MDRRTCVWSSFGKDKMHFCDCDEERFNRCKQSYGLFKRENTKQQRNQESFPNAKTKDDA